MSPNGMKVVLKFFSSKGPNGEMKLVSRTLGKLSLIEEKYVNIVKDQEIWICEIEKEIHPNRNQGFFLVKPVELVPPEKIKKLIPGFYSHVSHERTIFLYPKSSPNEPWLVSLNTRKAFNNKYTSVIVPIEYQEKKE